MVVFPSGSATTSPARGDLPACPAMNGPLLSVFPAPSSLPPCAASGDGFAFVSEEGAAGVGLIPVMGIGEGDAGADVANLNPVSDKELLTTQRDWKRRKKRSK